MEIILGYDFDSGPYPDALSQNDAAAGKAVLGPFGLISVLETRLGLKTPRVPQAVRVGQYLNSLKAADQGNRFYSRSFEADAWSTAQELLNWRDQFLISGWNKTFPVGISRRLSDFADVEAIAAPLLSMGFGERLREIYKRLPLSSGVGIDSVSITEPEKFWPYAWKQLFQAMSSAGINCNFIETPEATANGDLGMLQECLKNNARAKQPVAGDGSLLLIVGQTEADAAEALSEWLAAKKDANRDVVLIKGMGSRLLDEALHRQGMPRLGSDSRSRWRAALQMLLLAIENAWKPVNPHLLLEILTLPYSPVPQWAGWYFVQALQEHPGIGGKIWVQAREKAVAEKRERLNKENVPAAKSKSKLKDFEANLDFWLGLERFQPDEGMPVKAALNICAKVARLATSRGGYEGNPILHLAMEQAMELESTIKASRLEKITRPQLNRMVDDVFQFSGVTPGLSSEAASWHVVKTPGQIWGIADTIIWWGFLNPDIHHTSHIWTAAEFQAMNEVGIHMECPREKRLREAMFWQRPVMMAGKRLLLVMHKSEASEPTQCHPLWDDIKQAVLPTALDEQKITLNAGRLRKQPELAFGSQHDIRIVKRTEVEPLERPSAKSNWEIPPNKTCFREEESASSLEKLMGCPLAWLLTYQAKIRKGALISLPQGLQLTGILAHALVERLFENTGILDSEEAKEKSLAIYDEVLPQIAAGLFQPGRAIERQQNRENISNAATALVKFLNDCDLSVEGTEKKLSRVNEKLGTLVSGTLDLILKVPDGGRVLLDLKWALSSKYRREELKNGVAVQLATYAWLLGEGSGQLPSAGYYMLKQKELLCSDVSLFSGTIAQNGPSLSKVWDSVVADCREKMDLLIGGLAFASGADAEGDENSKSCRFCEYGVLCGVKQGDKL